jgi:SAM-dependent methyltransferase
VYDRQDFAVSLPGADRVDFWVMDALALPLAPGSADVVAALNVLDCVADPRRLLSELAALLHADSRLLLATPFDWSTRATEPQNWIGGHSQRAAHGGSAEAFMAAMIAEIGLVTLGDDRSFPWHTRLHARSTLQYQTCLLALEVKQALLF